MKTETYRGRKLKAVKGRGADWGYSRATLNGVSLGKHLGDEDAALKWMRGGIDHADEVGVASARYGAEWYAPGTFELCPEGHAMPRGGPCGHSWCVKQAAAREAERCTCDPAPVREHGDYSRPATYLHWAGCPAAEVPA